MTRRKPKNRTTTVCRKFKSNGCKIYVHTDRDAHDENGLKLGPVNGIRLHFRFAKDSDLDTVLSQVSDYLSREVQTVEKVLAE